MTTTASEGLRPLQRAAATGAVVLAGALLAPATSGGQPDEESVVVRSPALAYRCDTTSATHTAEVRVTWSVPGPVRAGEPVRQTDPTLTVTLDRSGVADLAARGASAVKGTADFTIRTELGGQDDAGERDRVAWRRFVVPSTSLPEDGPLELTAAGTGAPLTPAVPGELVFRGGELALLLAWDEEGAHDEAPGTGGGEHPDGGSDDGADGGSDGADGGSDGDVEPPPGTTAGSRPPGTGGGGGATRGAEEDTPVLVLECVPAPEADTTIGALTVGAGATAPGREGAGREDGPPSEDGARLPLDTEGPATGADAPGECDDFGDAQMGWCARLGGYTNVEALDAAAKVEPGIVNLAVPNITPCGDGSEWYWFCQTVTARLDHDGERRLPPTRNTFHAFGFMPTSVTVELTQVGDLEIAVRSQVIAPYDGSVVARASLSLRLDDVTVNGTPLDVGDDCRTRTPLDVSLTADYPGDYTPDQGGFLDGFLDIPPFSGCGTEEDLDPLMTNLVSGERYYVKMTQGRICDIRRNLDCPPEVPELQR
ncbi:DUF6801 domain-containing protein [Saccharomonospora saliphila]|uniref:DUF6801 domain-containing protein n=1 Tax=Saccharomonospora saliphila TaxID=369829 RepID=UPI00048AF0FC|nr:DUF6801 domain-containing protein [Saccharomonospora saliphila]